MEVRQAAIETWPLPFAASCELSEVGICHLSVTDHTTDLYIGERDSVRARTRDRLHFRPR